MQNIHHSIKSTLISIGTVLYLLITPNSTWAGEASVGPVHFSVPNDWEINKVTENHITICPKPQATSQKNVRPPTAQIWIQIQPLRDTKGYGRKFKSPINYVKLHFGDAHELRLNSVAWATSERKVETSNEITYVAFHSGKFIQVMANLHHSAKKEVIAATREVFKSLKIVSKKP